MMTNKKKFPEDITHQNTTQHTHTGHIYWTQTRHTHILDTNREGRKKSMSNENYEFQRPYLCITDASSHRIRITLSNEYMRRLQNVMQSRCRSHERRKFLDTEAETQLVILDELENGLAIDLADEDVGGGGGGDNDKYVEQWLKWGLDIVSDASSSSSSSSTSSSSSDRHRLESAPHILLPIDPNPANAELQLLTNASREMGPQQRERQWRVLPRDVVLLVFQYLRVDLDTTNDEQERGDQDCMTYGQVMARFSNDPFRKYRLLFTSLRFRNCMTMAHGIGVLGWKIVMSQVRNLAIEKGHYMLANEHILQWVQQSTMPRLEKVDVEGIHSMEDVFRAPIMHNQFFASKVRSLRLSSVRWSQQPQDGENSLQKLLSHFSNLTDLSLYPAHEWPEGTGSVSFVEEDELALRHYVQHLHRRGHPMHRLHFARNMRLSAPEESLPIFAHCVLRLSLGAVTPVEEEHLHLVRRLALSTAIYLPSLRNLTHLSIENLTSLSDIHHLLHLQHLKLTVPVGMAPVPDMDHLLRCRSITSLTLKFAAGQVLRETESYPDGWGALIEWVVNANTEDCFRDLTIQSVKIDDCIVDRLFNAGAPIRIQSLSLEDCRVTLASHTRLIRNRALRRLYISGKTHSIPRGICLTAERLGLKEVCVITHDNHVP